MSNNIDPVDLRPLKLKEEIRVNGHFYRRNEDGTFSRAMLSIEDLKNWPLVGKVREDQANGLLYIRINKPWQSFV